MGRTDLAVATSCAASKLGDIDGSQCARRYTDDHPGNPTTLRPGPTFMSLPTEIHLLISQQLLYPDALSLKHTNRYFHELVYTGVNLKVEWLVQRRSLHLDCPNNVRCDLGSDLRFCRGSVALLMKRRREHIECESKPGIGCIVFGTTTCSHKRKWSTLDDPNFPIPTRIAPVSDKLSPSAIGIDDGVGDGCTTCRRQHRKCDEQRPVCSACQARGAQCVYQRPLRWARLHISTPIDQQQPLPSAQSDSLSRPGIPLASAQRQAAAESSAHGLEPTQARQAKVRDDNPSSNEPPESMETVPYSLVSWSISNDLTQTLSRAMRHFSDEIAFKYYLKRVCWCTPAYDSNLNPYRKLGFMALSHPVLLRGVLSVSAAHMEMYGQTNTGVSCMRQLHALRELRSALDLLERNKIKHVKGASNEGNPTSDLSNEEITLAAVVMQTSSVLMAGLWTIEMHIKCALYLIQHLGFLDRAPSSVLTRTVIHRLAMVDVMLAFVRTRRPQAPLDFYMYQIHEELDREEPSFREMHGCHQPVLSFLARIAILSADLSSGTSTKSEIEARGYQLETEMRLWGHHYYGSLNTEAASSNFTSQGYHQIIPVCTALDTVCECFYWTAHIVLLKRVLSERTNSARVQFIRRRVFDLINGLAPGCGPDSSLAFPFYMSACEAISPGDREWVRRRHLETFAVYRDDWRVLLMAAVERIWAKDEAQEVVG